jgi:hypothetical protein
MAIYSTNRFKNLDADRVELAFRESAPDVTNDDTSLVAEAPDVTSGDQELVAEAPDVTTTEDSILAEAALIDSLLESLED